MSRIWLVCSDMGAKPVSEHIGGLVAHERKRRGWTQQRLAEAIGEHGGGLDRAAVAKIESGVRNVSIDEVFLFAAALDVPPALVLLPLGLADLVQVTPRSVVHPHLAYEWFTGQEALTDAQRFVINRGAWLEAARRLHLWDRLRRLQDDAQHGAGTGTDPPPEAMAAHREALVALHAHLMAMAAAGLRPPAMAGKTIQAMEDVGLDVSELPVYMEDE